MRKIKQIAALTKQVGDVQATKLYAVCDDGTLWRKLENSDISSDWQIVPGPPEGEPGDDKEPTLEELAEELNEHTGTFLGRGLRE